MSQSKHKVVEAHVRLFDADVKALKKLAHENGTSWVDELRRLVRHALLAPPQILPLKGADDDD